MRATGLLAVRLSREGNYLRTVTPSSIVPYIVMPPEPALDDGPDTPVQPAASVSTASAAAKMILNMRHSFALTSRRVVFHSSARMRMHAEWPIDISAGSETSDASSG
jgi:hypothetical protein